MTVNDLEIYHAATSPNSRRVRMFLAEKGLTVPLVPVDLGKGEQRSDAYRAINFGVISKKLIRRRLYWDRRRRTRRW
jgi:Glutathione S-transferase, N-terminal domain